MPEVESQPETQMPDSQPDIESQMPGEEEDDESQPDIESQMPGKEDEAEEEDEEEDEASQIPEDSQPDEESQVESQMPKRLRESSKMEESPPQKKPKVEESTPTHMASSTSSKSVTVTITHGFEFGWSNFALEKWKDVWLWLKPTWKQDMSVIIRRYTYEESGLLISFIVYAMDGNWPDSSHDRAYPCIKFATKQFQDNDEGFERFLNIILKNTKFKDDFAYNMITQEELLFKWKRSKSRTETLSYEPPTQEQTHF